MASPVRRARRPRSPAQVVVFAGLVALALVVVAPLLVIILVNSVALTALPPIGDAYEAPGGTMR